MKRLYFILFAVLFPAAYAKADIVNEYIEIACRPELNTLTISQDSVNGAFAEQAFTKNGKTLSEKYGIIDLMTLFKVDKDFSNQEEKSYHAQCRLQLLDAAGKNDKPFLLDITLKGIAQNTNPQGQCGGWRSFSVTVKNGKKTYIDALPFGENCSSERGVSKVEINPATGYMTVDTTHPLDNSLFWINHNRLETITLEKIYPGYDLYGDRASPWTK